MIAIFHATLPQYYTCTTVVPLLYRRNAKLCHVYTFGSNPKQFHQSVIKVSVSATAATDTTANLVDETVRYQLSKEGGE